MAQTRVTVRRDTSPVSRHRLGWYAAAQIEPCPSNKAMMSSESDRENVISAAFVLTLAAEEVTFRSKVKLVEGATPRIAYAVWRSARWDPPQARPSWRR